MPPWNLSETNYGHVKARPYEVAVLPLGATEPHNLHLPYGTDTIQVEAVGRLACEAAHARGARVALLPSAPLRDRDEPDAVPAGDEPRPLDRRPGGRPTWWPRWPPIRRPQVRAAERPRRQRPQVAPARAAPARPRSACSCRPLVEGGRRPPSPGCSTTRATTRASWRRAWALAHFGPGWSARAQADAGRGRRRRGSRRVNRGWVEITRPWHLLTTNSGAGDPDRPPPRRAERLTEVVVERLADFLVDLAASRIDVRFPF